MRWWIYVRGVCHDAHVGRLYQLASDAGAERLAQQWYESIDLTSQVGTRHHIVPRAILRRFANRSNQIRLRDRITSKVRIVSVGDVAVKDFYTFIDLNMEPNGSMEVWLSEVEAEFARVIRPYLSTSAFGGARQPQRVDRFALDTFVAVQALRGMRTRRAMELVADYGMKLLNQDKISPQEIQELEIVPHQNDHIQFMHRASEALADHLSHRPVSVAWLGAPLLIIGDEPVVLIPRDDAPKGDLRELIHLKGEYVPPERLVQISNGLGFHDADEVILPLSPHQALIYGPMGARSDSMVWNPAGSEAVRIAREINLLQARNAFGWVATHPDGPHLAQIAWPKPAPAVTIYDDQSLPAMAVNARPHARPRRFLK